MKTTLERAVRQVGSEIDSLGRAWAVYEHDSWARVTVAAESLAEVGASIRALAERFEGP